MPSEYLKQLERILDLLGADLEDAGERLELLVAGGACLLICGYISRPTRDVDVIGLKTSKSFVKPPVLPQTLERSLERVRRIYPLPADWMNLAASSVMDHGGLPEGFEARLVTKQYGGLILDLLGRFDLICLKLHAAVDRGTPEGKHARDLAELHPTPDELVRAAQWCVTHDPSEGFRTVLCTALEDLGVSNAAEHLPAGL